MHAQLSVIVNQSALHVVCRTEELTKRSASSTLAPDVKLLHAAQSALANDFRTVAKGKHV